MESIKKHKQPQAPGAGFIANCITDKPAALLKTGEMSVCQNVRDSLPGLHKRLGLALLNDQTLVETVYDFGYTEEYGWDIISKGLYSYSSDLQVAYDGYDGGAAGGVLPTRTAKVGAFLVDTDFYIYRGFFIFSLNLYDKVVTGGRVTVTPTRYLSELAPGSHMPKVCLVAVDSGKEPPTEATPPYAFEDWGTVVGRSRTMISDTVVDTSLLEVGDVIVFELNAAGLEYIAGLEVNGEGKFALEMGLLEYNFDELQPYEDEAPIPPGTEADQGFFEFQLASEDPEINGPMIELEEYNANGNSGKIISCYNFVKQSYKDVPYGETGPAIAENHLLFANSKGMVQDYGSLPGEFAQTAQNTGGIYGRDWLKDVYNNESAAEAYEEDTYIDQFSIRPSWSNFNGLLVYSNGLGHYLMTGSRQKIKACFVSDGADGIPLYNSYKGKDVWDEVVNDDLHRHRDAYDEYVYTGSIPEVDNSDGQNNDTKGLFICTQTPARRFDFLFNDGGFNTNASALFVQHYNRHYQYFATGDLYGPSVESTYGFTQDGYIEFTTGATWSEMPSTFFGVTGYWYRIFPKYGEGDGKWSAMDIKRIEYTSYYGKRIENMWDDVAIDIIEAQVYYPTDGDITAAYRTYVASLVDIKLLPTTGKIYLSTFFPATEFFFDVGATPNTAADRSLTIKVWTGDKANDGWETPGSDDGTYGFSRSGSVKLYNNITNIKAAPYKFNGAEVASYWYEISVGHAVSDNAAFTVTYAPEIPEIDKQFGAKGNCNAVWKDRVAYTFDRDPSYIYVTAEGTPNVLQGNDYAVLQAGDGRDNRVNCMKKFHNELMTWQEEAGLDGGCTTLFEGYSPATFGKLVISSKIGIVGAAAAVVVDGPSAVPTRTTDAVQTRAYWVSHYGIFLSDGRVVVRISDDIQNYFNPGNQECLRRGFEYKCWATYDATENVVRFGLVCGDSAEECNIFPVYSPTTGLWSFDTYQDSIVCMTPVEATSGDVRSLMVACSPFKMFQANVGLNDAGQAIESRVVIEINNYGALMDLEEVIFRMKAHTSGECLFYLYENGILNSEQNETVDMTAEVVGENVRRERLLKSGRQASNFSFEFSNEQVNIDLFLYDYFVKYEILSDR